MREVKKSMLSISSNAVRCPSGDAEEKSRCAWPELREEFGARAVLLGPSAHGYDLKPWN
jgi:hypothetical protein